MILHRFCEKVSVHPRRSVLVRRASFSARGLRFVVENQTTPIVEPGQSSTPS